MHVLYTENKYALYNYKTKDILMFNIHKPDTSLSTCTAL